MVIFILLLSLSTSSFASGNDWNYQNEGPDVWSDSYPLCAARLQSPIDIKTACTKYVSYKPFQFTQDYSIVHNFTLQNNGHTIVGTLNDSYSSSLKLVGGNLNGSFEFVTFHLHWGENYRSGSEHQVNGIKYAGEIHFIYENPKTHQVAVLGIFMESARNLTINETIEKTAQSPSDTIDEWKKYFDVAQQLKKPDNTINLSLNFSSLMGDSLIDFWRYEGSLTTPPCTEGIIWTIFREPIVFTESELESFRTNIYFEDYRDPQPLNIDIVFHIFKLFNFLHIDRNTIEMPIQLIVMVTTALVIPHAIFGVLWNYRDLGPDVWSDTYPLCASRSQSPINIKTACTTFQPFVPFQFSSSYSVTNNFTLRNNGHTIVGQYSGNDSSSFNLTGGALNGTFRFVNFHLHWGENYKSGSEHQVNGKKYAGEIHFVHRNPDTGQIAVLGMFMESVRNFTIHETIEKTDKVSVSTVNEWKRYFDVAGQLTQYDNKTVLNLNLVSLMGDSLSDFWRYAGSLTTPPCTEGIVWTMFRDPIIFTESELESFRTNVYFEDYRGPQPLYDRVVHRSFENETLSTIPEYNCCSGAKRQSFYKHSMTGKQARHISYGP
ncbi:unnamed protein product [Adineta ricciae]|uniref:Carbonic anhydrase n=1 Tax=Adineta ricciae TaxID=249248 RepID=A0A814S5R4_ADIRI|nr:unnamed protein product [Adineta ricciae]